MSDIKTLADLRPDHKNAKKGTHRGRGLVETSLQKYGAGAGCFAGGDGATSVLPQPELGIAWCVIVGTVVALWRRRG